MTTPRDFSIIHRDGLVFTVETGRTTAKVCGACYEPNRAGLAMQSGSVIWCSSCGVVLKGGVEEGEAA